MRALGVIYARRPCSAQYYPNLMSLGTIAGTRMWGCAAPFAIADSCQGARSRFVPPWDAWLICDHGARFAHWPIIPRGSLCDNQVWIVLIMHSLICSSVCSIPPRVSGSTAGTPLGAIPRGCAPWDGPSWCPLG